LFWLPFRRDAAQQRRARRGEETRGAGRRDGAASADMQACGREGCRIQAPRPD